MRLLELGSDLRPRLGAPTRAQHHAQDAVDAKPGMPEALVGVAFSVHLVFGHGVGAPLNRQSHEGRARERRNGPGHVD